MRDGEEQGSDKQAPAVAVPSGGGAIRGIGESFKTNPATGTASLTVPVPVSPARGGFQPQLALSYDSGNGNGPFGFGWALSLARIERRTERGMPRYDDSDTFMLSGAEDLVPVGDDEERDGHLVRRFRPRVDNLLARVERWTRRSDGDVHWRTITRENVTHLYGADEESRLQDPADSTRVYAWLICESHDDKGSGIVYEYAAEDSDGVDAGRAHEARRTATDRGANRYPKRIRYGNVVSRLDPSPAADWRDEFLFELVFDYGEGHLTPAGAESVTASNEAAGTWPARPDPFSSYRPGFEIRTYRRCRRLLMFHRFEELAPEPCLVRATELDYADLDYDAAPDVDTELAHQGSTRFASLLRSIVQSGFVRTGAGTYRARSLPPLELEYGRARIDEEVRTADGIENLPIGLSGGYRLVDLDGEGVAGVLSEHQGGWHYKPPLGEGRFGPQETVASRPALGALGGPRQLVDLDGDGRLDLMVLDREAPGFHERTEDGGWDAFRTFASRPALGLEDPNTRLIDLDGDGLADVLVTEDEAIVSCRSLGEEGFAPPERVLSGWDEEEGPRVVLADRTESMYLADMSGDGLSDLVRIRNGEVCYWPSLGYGRFGAKVTMDGAPWFDEPDRFDHPRLHLADLDGSGVTDIVYLGADGARLYLNRSGNEWSGARPLPRFPEVDRLSSVTTADLLGRGTSCLVWSTPLPDDGGGTLRYLDPMADGKPHMLKRLANNLGSETKISYASSTRFYLEDREAGRAWATRLPFPVQVVERVESLDRVSGNRFVQRFAYHHGHFDGVEREFRGFAQVDQWDTEEWAAMNAGEVPGGTNFDAGSDVPPALTRTWFHTGAFVGRDNVSRALAGEYYREPGLSDAAAAAMLLEDTPLPGGLDPEEEREACRALKGSTLRVEVYGLDGTANAVHPYTVSERSFTVRRLHGREQGRHAVFLTHERENVEYTYERDPEDPRVKHRLTLDVDDFGNERRAAVVAYPRRKPQMTLDPRERARQAELSVVYTESDRTNAVAGPDDYRSPQPADVRTYELTGLALAPGRSRFAPGDLEPLPAAAQKKLFQRERTIYRRDDLSGPLPLGQLQSRSLPFEGLKLAFTPALVSEIFGTRVDDAMLSAAGYSHSEGDSDWWAATGRVFYSPDSGHTAAQELAHAREHFFQPCRQRDPFGAETTIEFDRYDLLPAEARDPAGNRVTAGERDADPEQPLVRNGIDYRVLKPSLVMDPNRNRTEVAFDALGLVTASAAMGKPEDEPALGDQLAGFAADLSAAALESAFEDPAAGGEGLLGEATKRFVHDVGAYHRTRGQAQPSPPAVLTLSRETHASEPGGGETQIQCTLSYSDGFAREIQKKTRVEPEGEVDPRWVSSGWKVFDNKGKPVREFEPYFTGTHRFEFDVEAGVSAIRFHDPLERVVATLYPNHAWEKAVFDAWGRETWDPNDTVTIADPSADGDVGDRFARLPEGEHAPTWRARRIEGGLGPQEQAAAEKASVHGGTPSLLTLDSRGQTVLTVAHNAFGDGRADERYATRVGYDARGDIREVRDAKDRLVARFGYDLLGNCLRKQSMEAGDRVTLDDVAGKPGFSWDGLGRRLRTVYDGLRRPVEVWLDEGAGAEVLVERIAFGEGAAGAEAANLRGQAFERRDQGGLARMLAYDFKGNLAHSERRFATEYKGPLDWSAAVPLETSAYEHRTVYDALNRPLELTAPDGSRVIPGYSQAGLVERVEAAVRGGAAEPFAAAIAYDAKGRRTLVELGNGAQTSYEYDPETFRLTRLRTTRNAIPLQDLRYTYDAVGNVTQVRDEAQQDVFFRNRRVEPSCEYTYDALYQLIAATGREHLAGGVASSADDAPRTGLVHPHDGNALGRYRESYVYDEVGNLLELAHRGTDPLNAGWTRTLAYEETSQLEPGRASNRLTSATVGEVTDPYDDYDADGNMLRMPHLDSLEWDFHDRLRVSERGGERTYYVYERDGTRLRKVTEDEGGQVKDERRYLSGFEVYVRKGAGGLVRETLHVREGNHPLALVETRTDDGSAPLARYQLGDPLESVRVELDGEAQVISYEEYTPFGATALQAAAPQLAAPKRYRYTGRERDEESGLYHLKERYYAPWLGRWTSPDPAELEDSLNRYAYVRNRPTAMLDPEGRSGVAPEALAPVLPLSGGASAASGSGSGGGGGSGGGSGGGGGSGKKGQGVGGFFDAIASGLADVANFLQEWMPGLIAAPLAGVVDILGGFFRTLGGIFSWRGDTVLKGLKEMGLGVLRIFGWKEIAAEPWDRLLGASGDWKGPRTIAGDIDYALAHVREMGDAWKNGYKAWHAGSNAALTHRLGPNPINLLGLFVAGLIHESPADPTSWAEEQKNQGTVNHILDLIGDIIANVVGMVIGLLLPRKPAVAVAAFVGRWFIPGPADNDPKFGHGKSYKGNPLDAWWNWKYGSPPPPKP